MQFISTVTQKGQATIPAPIRKKLGIKPSTRVIFELTDKGQAMIKPAPDFFSLKGSIKSKRPFDINAMDRDVEDAVVKDYLESIT